ncbi:hydrogenase maturation nickel metallochaperone HypA [candidate division WOR-3 bacterium]|uniref:Hydrogenase maturation factor HypA n=1 Tax=candidate division WOR-3 bacterium TaxID=2052148 RepID=A0A660SIX6_UNCW3|nr:MAG: hydrogenase maturation nickel metallochaperone HypA [candidate division WOR-3 bacterium]
MHELAITESILEIVLKEANRNRGKRVREIGIVLGRMSSFVPECIEYYFDFLSRGTIAEGAKLKFTLISPVIVCRHCDQEIEIEDPFMVCPICGNTDTKLISGRECYVEYIEVEDETDQD